MISQKLYLRIEFGDRNDKFRATGVLVNYKGYMVTIRARREVILSSGAIGSPHLLMLSGIGPKQHLRDFNVTIV